MGSFADSINTIDAASPTEGLQRVYIDGNKSQAKTSVPAGGFKSALDNLDSSIAKPSKPDEAKPKTRDVGTPEAFGRGMASGVTANFYDELRGLHEAGGAHPDDPMSLGTVLKGAFGRMTGDQAAAQKYDEAVTRERALNKQGEEQHPVANLAGNVAGALVLPVGSAAGGATLAARAGRGAVIGAAYGGAAGAGEGEGIGDRATRATTGALLGGAIGAAAPPIVEGVIQGGRALTAPVVSALRGAVNPEAEAGRRVVGAVSRDMQLDPTAKNRLTPQEFAANSQNGGPAALLDTGGETTRALARSAANTSPEGRTLLNDTINNRFETQTGRITDWMRQSFHFPDAVAQKQAIAAEAKLVNKPAYDKAMKEGAGGVWDKELQRLSGAPAIQEAANSAIPSLANRGIAEGFQAPRVNPLIFDRETGRASLKTMPNGNQIVPDLRFWDQVKRNLDPMISKAEKYGDKSRVDELTQLKTQLVEHLDTKVGSYKEARAGAAHFFGADNALEAGKKFVDSKMGNAEARQALAKMPPLQRQLFQDGFVSHFVDKLNEGGDRRSILNKIAESPAARERLNMALGPQKAGELEASLRVEGIMDTARKAIQGNSTTTRQLVELGLAGGAAGTGGVGAYNMDPKQMTYAAIAGALIGGKHHIDTRLANRVAEMLTSKDPAVLLRGARVVARDHRLMNGLRSIDKRLASVGGEHSPSGLIAGGAVPGHADDNQPSR